MIDSHTHLQLISESTDDVVQAARDAGVTRMLNVGLDPESGRAVLESADLYPEVFAAIGLHPNSCSEFTSDTIAQLRSLAEHPKCVAIGETGLDYYHDRAPKELQTGAFEGQIELARELSKPLIIHTREADQDTIRMLTEQAQDIEVVLHCFSMPDRLDECLEQGWWISFAGNVTYPKSTELAAASARVPLDRILVETDAPFLTAQAVRKHRNQPAFVTHTAAFIAEQRGISYEELEAAVQANSKALFGW